MFWFIFLFIQSSYGDCSSVYNISYDGPPLLYSRPHPADGQFYKNDVILRPYPECITDPRCDDPPTIEDDYLLTLDPWYTRFDDMVREMPLLSYEVASGGWESDLISSWDPLESYQKELFLIYASWRTTDEDSFTYEECRFFSAGSWKDLYYTYCNESQILTPKNVDVSNN